jgi:hypothetical protein
MTNQLNPTGNVELEEIETTQWRELNEALLRLEENEDFKKVILDGYFKDKAVNQVSLLATDYIKRNNLRGFVMEELVAISALQGYFAMLKNLGGSFEDEVD